MTDRYELSRAGPSSLKKEDDPFISTENDTGRRFRLVFSAERCGRKKVYYLEPTAVGTTRLRQVVKREQDRRGKKDDKLLAIFPGKPDMDMVRLAIASANREEILTGVRWEVYLGADCQQLLEMGRFDVVDLLGRSDLVKAKLLADKGTVSVDLNPYSWDFDGLLTGHQCPKCKRTATIDFIIFFPEAINCECGLQGERDMDLFKCQIQTLISRLTKGQAEILDIPMSGREDCPSYLIEYHATPLFAWVVMHLLKGFQIRHCWHTLHELGKDKGHNAFEAENLHRLYRRSILPLLEVELLREAFVRLAKKSINREGLKDTSQSYRPRWATDEQLAEMRRRWRDEDEVTLLKEVQVLTQVGDWIFGAEKPRGNPDDAKTYHKTTEEVVYVMGMLVTLMEDLLDYIGKRLEQGDTVNV